MVNFIKLNSKFLFENSCNIPRKHKYHNRNFVFWILLIFGIQVNFEGFSLVMAVETVKPILLNESLDFTYSKVKLRTITVETVSNKTASADGANLRLNSLGSGFETPRSRTNDTTVIKNKPEEITIRSDLDSRWKEAILSLTATNSTKINETTHENVSQPGRVSVPSERPFTDVHIPKRTSDIVLSGEKLNLDNYPHINLSRLNEMIFQQMEGYVTIVFQNLTRHQWDTNVKGPLEVFLEQNVHDKYSGYLKELFTKVTHPTIEEAYLEAQKVIPKVAIHGLKNSSSIWGLKGSTDNTRYDYNANQAERKVSTGVLFTTSNFSTPILPNNISHNITTADAPSGINKTTILTENGTTNLIKKNNTTISAPLALNTTSNAIITPQLPTVPSTKNVLKVNTNLTSSTPSNTLNSTSIPLLKTRKKRSYVMKMYKLEFWYPYDMIESKNYVDKDAIMDRADSSLLYMTFYVNLVPINDIFLPVTRANRVNSLILLRLIQEFEQSHWNSIKSEKGYPERPQMVYYAPTVPKEWLGLPSPPLSFEAFEDVYKYLASALANYRHNILRRRKAPGGMHYLPWTMENNELSILTAIALALGVALILGLVVYFAVIKIRENGNGPIMFESPRERADRLVSLVRNRMINMRLRRRGYETASNVVCQHANRVGGHNAAVTARTDGCHTLLMRPLHRNPRNEGEEQRPTQGNQIFHRPAIFGTSGRRHNGGTTHLNSCSVANRPKHVTYQVDRNNYGNNNDDYYHDDIQGVGHVDYYNTAFEKCLKRKQDAAARTVKVEDETLRAPPPPDFMDGDKFGREGQSQVNQAGQTERKKSERVGTNYENVASAGQNSAEGDKRASVAGSYETNVIQELKRSTQLQGSVVDAGKHDARDVSMGRCTTCQQLLLQRSTTNNFLAKDGANRLNGEATFNNSTQHTRL